MSVVQAYSDRLHQPEEENDHETMEDMSAEYHSQQVKRDRVKRLSAETNRRRKALELKKKLEAQKEEKRRSEVLEARRRKQQEATQRFQRLNQRSPRKQQSRQGIHQRPGVNNYTDPRLQNGVHMAKGHRVPITPDTQPAVDDVLRMVGGQSNPAHGGYRQHPLMTASPREHRQDYSTSDGGVQHERVVAPGLDRNGNLAPREPAEPDHSYHQKYHGYTTIATPTQQQQQQRREEVHHQPFPPGAQQTREADNIQCELAEQQRVFIEQQRKSLMEFNRALLHEETSGRKDEELDCSSVSSLDSLETEQDRKPPRNGNPAMNNSRQFQHDGGQSHLRISEGGEQRSTQSGRVPLSFIPPPLDVPSQPQPPGEQFVWSGSQGYDHDHMTSRTTAAVGNVRDSSQPVHSSGIQSRQPLHNDGYKTSAERNETTPNHSFVNRNLHGKQWATEQNLVNSSKHVHSTGIQNYQRDQPSHNDVHRNSAGRNESNPNHSSVNGNPPHGYQRVAEQNPGNGASPTEEVSGQQPVGTPQKGQRYKWDQNGRRTDGVLTLKVNSPQTRPNQNSPKYQAGGKPKTHLTKTAATPVYTVAPERKPLHVTEGTAQNHVFGPQGVIPMETQRPAEVSAPSDHILHSEEVRDHETYGQYPKDHRSPKGILRKVSKYPADISREHGAGQKWGQRDLRDSMEITSATQMKRTSSGKSVRWTDIAYSDSDQCSTSERGGKGVPSGRQTGALDRTKPPAINARLVQQKLTASAEMEQQNRRGLAGSSRTPFRTEFDGLSNGTPNVQSKEPRVQSRGYNVPTGKPPTGKLGDPTKGMMPKRVNGMTLNKTPTDEEINQLWDKVRTCLHSREGESIDNNPGPAPGMRRVSSDQSLTESGQRLTAQLRLARPSRPVAATAVQSEQGGGRLKKFHTVPPRWRANSDSGTAVTKRASLLAAGSPDRTGKRPPIGTNGRTRAGPSPPVSSPAGPNRSVTRVAQQNRNNAAVDDSLLAFQQAELLAHQNCSEAEMEAALNHQNNHHQNNKVLSALSLEEQRLLESLDRLNKKLSITSDISTNYATMTPRPPAHAPSFRGHRPVSIKHYGTNSPGRPGLRVRSNSAERESSRLWTYR